MVFYKIEASPANKEEEKEFRARGVRSAGRTLAEHSEYLYQRSEGRGMVFTVCISENKVMIAALGETEEELTVQIGKYIKKLPVEIENPKIEETTFGAFESLLNAASHNGYVNDSDDVLKKFNISDLGRYGSCDFGESMIDDSLSVEDCRKIADSHLFSGTMNPELERICQSGGKNSIGHPVHYLITVDERDIRKSVYKALLSTLYQNGRIKNKRYCFVDYNKESRFPGGEFDTLYRANEGGAVVIRYTDSDEKENGFAKRSIDIIAALCETAVKYKNRVLTVICLPKASNKIKQEFYNNFPNTAFVELFEDIAFDETAVDYLKLKAKEYKIRIDKNLTDGIEAGKGYTATELNGVFDAWHSKKLRNEVYPQYKTAQTAKQKIKDEAPNGTAYERLSRLIGLKSAKNVMNNALNYFKAQKLFKERGMFLEHPSMHMVFTGNPGTAKTTVARLFSEIMKENGLLPKGEIYEVGRADIVGKYVGSTAPLVKAAFKRAKGGVLFIDEAYSLVDDRDGLYGDEAINTIVQEMENNRDDTIVIFAGYPDKMEGFLNKNPGLRSRIAFHVPFDDYSARELCEIAELIANEMKMTFTVGASDKLETMFEEARENSDFGNGRFVRNVIEKAKMAQANRLMQMNFEEITDEQLKTITAEDIEIPKRARAADKKIGFCA